MASTILLIIFSVAAIGGLYYAFKYRNQDQVKKN